MNPAIKLACPDFNVIFKSFRGTAHQIERCCDDECGAVVADICKLQEEFKSLLNSIDYTRPLEGEGRTILRHYKHNCEALFTKHIDNIQKKRKQYETNNAISEHLSQSYNQLQRLRRARHSVIQTSIAELFKCGNVRPLN